MAWTSIIEEAEDRFADFVHRHGLDQPVPPVPPRSRASEGVARAAEAIARPEGAQREATHPERPIREIRSKPLWVPPGSFDIGEPDWRRGKTVDNAIEDGAVPEQYAEVADWLAAGGLIDLSQALELARCLSYMGRCRMPSSFIGEFVGLIEELDHFLAHVPAEM